MAVHQSKHNIKEQISIKVNSERKITKPIGILKSIAT